MTNEHLNKKLNTSHAVFAGFLVLIMYTVFLWANKIVPFGEHTWLVYNMKRQYADFYGYFKSILSGENNIFYSFSTTLGSGTVGLFIYYFTSPFLLIIALFPREMFPLALSLVIGLKLSLSALTMDIFLQRFCGKSTYLCSVSYGLCGYLIANSMNIMWLDVLILLPIVMLMTERLMNEGRILGYIISVAIILYLNYYIAYMVLIFVLIWFLLRMWVVKEKSPTQAIYRLGVGTILAASVNIAFLAPAFLELKNNGLIGEVNKENISIVVNNTSLVEALSKLYSLSFNSAQIYWEAPMIFCGVIMPLLVILFFANKKISIKERIAMFAVILLFIITFAYSRLNLIWHLGISHTEFPYREAVFCVFVIITCACRGLTELREGISKKGFVAAFLLSMVMTIILFTKNVIMSEPWKIALNIILILLSFLALSVIIYSNKKIYIITAAVLLVMLQFFDIGLNASYIYINESVNEERASEFSIKTAYMEEAVKQLKAKDKDFYRVDSWSSRQQNDGMMFAYNSVTNYSFSSLIYVRDFLQKLGFDDDETYLEYGHNNTEAADSILGIKYILTDVAHKDRMHKDYKLAVDGKIQAYENPYALSVAMGVYHEMSGEASNPFSYQEEIYSRIAGAKVSLFIPAEVEETEVVFLTGRPEKTYKVTAEKEGEMYFYMTELIDNFDNMEVYINGEFYTYYGNDACLKVLNLGYMEKGDDIFITIKADDEDEFGNALFMTEDTEALNAAYEFSLSRQAKVEKISSSHLKFTIDSEYTVGDGLSGKVGVFTTIPYEKGWTVKVAGVKVTPIEAYYSLMYIPVTEALQQAELPPGEDLVVEMRYIPDGLIIGVAFSIITIIIMILVAFLRKSEADYFEYEEE